MRRAGAIAALASGVTAHVCVPLAVLAGVSCLAMTACTRKTKSDRPLEDLGRLDLADASQRLHAVVTDCAGVGRALDTLAASSSLRARPLIGLVDETVELARARCSDPGALETAVRGSHAAHLLARAKLAATPEAALRVLDDGAPAKAAPAQAAPAQAAPAKAAPAKTAPAHAAIELRRSELLELLGRPAEALAQLSSALAREAAGRGAGSTDRRAIAPDPARAADPATHDPTLDPDRARERSLQVAALAASGQTDRAATLVTGAPIEQRRALAHRLVNHAPASRLAALASAEGSPLEIAVAAGDRLEEQHGPAAALAARTRATTLAPDDADLFAALARSQIAAGRLDDALASYDRAAALAPAQPTFRLAPIRALVAAEQHARARARVARLADEARAQSEPQPLVTASHAAVAAGIPHRAVELMELARARHPRDGRLAFELALRRVDAGDRTAAIDAFVELLVCGAHRRPWHRHELAGKLVTIATDAPAKRTVLAALAAQRRCEPADPADLATYVAQLRAQLAPQADATR